MGSARVCLAFGAVLLALAVPGCGGDGETPTEASAPVAAESTAGVTPPPVAAGTEEQEAPPLPRGTEAQFSAIHSSISAVLTSGDPALACEKFVTERFVRAAYGDHAGCVAAAVPASTADSLRPLSAGSNGKLYIAEVVVSGGPLDGDTITVLLVREGGVFKVDSMRSDAPPGP